MMRRKAAHSVMIALVYLFDHTTLFVTKMVDWIAPASTPHEAITIIHETHSFALSGAAWLITWHVSLLIARFIRSAATLFIEIREEAARRFDRFCELAWLNTVRKIDDWARLELARISADTDMQNSVAIENFDKVP